MALTVNVFGGRDVGKTTLAMHAGAELRWQGTRTSIVYGPRQLWDEAAPDVVIHVFHRNSETLTPHEAAETCAGTLTFLVLRRKDYVFPAGFVDRAGEPALRRHWEGVDARLEATLREGQVRYKSLPGVRGSVPYIIDKITRALEERGIRARR